ncbi:uncharacterized protein MONOS_18575 [Monocercomonoides exilis]|uniref:uncharacterized protein n=1 Tax=Monocercomonoides exilis TaxID=2049356 RepID=UPI00355953DA|nr:hypothetical protein MONOS_18575 [Monocercomonoides exilis]
MELLFIAWVERRKNEKNGQFCVIRQLEANYRQNGLLSFDLCLQPSIIETLFTRAENEAVMLRISSDRRCIVFKLENNIAFTTFIIFISVIAIIAVIIILIFIKIILKHFYYLCIIRVESVPRIGNKASFWKQNRIDFIDVEIGSRSKKRRVLLAEKNNILRGTRRRRRKCVKIGNKHIFRRLRFMEGHFQAMNEHGEKSTFDAFQKSDNDKKFENIDE